MIKQPAPAIYRADNVTALPFLYALQVASKLFFHTLHQFNNFLPLTSRFNVDQNTHANAAASAISTSMP
jgi:hypothetical protein